MANVKEYILWYAKKKNDNYYEHPNTNGEFQKQVGIESTFIETPYQDVDWAYLSYIDYPDTTTQTDKDNHILANPEFKFKLISEKKANQMLENMGFDDNGNPYVTVSNFVFTDNRPLDI